MYYAAAIYGTNNSLLIYDTVRNKDTGKITMPNGYVQFTMPEDIDIGEMYDKTELSKFRDDIEMTIMEANFRGVKTLKDINLDTMDNSEWDSYESWFKHWAGIGISGSEVEDNTLDSGFLKITDYDMEFIPVETKKEYTFTIAPYTDEAGDTIISSDAMNALKGASFKAILDMVDEINKKLKPEYTKISEESISEDSEKDS